MNNKKIIDDDYKKLHRAFCKTDLKIIIINTCGKVIRVEPAKISLQIAAWLSFVYLQHIIHP